MTSRPPFQSTSAIATPVISHRREEDALHAGEREVPFDHVFVHVREFHLSRLFARERLDHADPARLSGASREIGEAFLHAYKSVVDDAHHERHRERQERERRERPQRQLGRNARYERERHNDDEYVLSVYMSPGPTTMRIASRSLVARAMRSPISNRSKRGRGSRWTYE